MKPGQGLHAAASPRAIGDREIRVLHVMAGAPQGGAERYFVRLCLSLRRAAVAQHAVVRPDPERVAQLEAGGVTVAGARFGNWFDFSTGRTIARAIESFRPNIVLSYMTRATKFVPRGDFVHVARLGGYYDLKHYRHCDHLVGNTPDLVEYFLRHGWERARVHFIPNFVDTHKHEPVDRSRYATPAAARLVLALGRLHRNKAYDVLIAAMAHVPEVYLWLAGDGPEKAALESSVAKLGLSDRVRFLGWQENPAPFFAAANVLAVPSRHEPLGNVILEAWAQDVPVVAAASQGPRFLIQDGVSGMLVPVEDPVAFAAALSRVLSDAAFAARLVAGGRAALAAQFSESAVVAQYLALFRQVLI